MMERENLSNEKGAVKDDNSGGGLAPPSGYAELEAMNRFFTNVMPGFHQEKDPEFLLEAIMKSLCDFYKAEWAGVVDADLDMGKMMPYYWYRSGVGSMAETSFSERAFSEEMRRWVKALENNYAVREINIDEVRKEFPDEYEFYRGLNIRSIIAAPFYRGSTGFLVVKNPQMNTGDRHLGLLQIVAQTAAGEAREKKRMDSAGKFDCPDAIREESDICVYLFGRVKIVTSYGIFPYSRLKGSVMEQVLRILFLRNKPMSSLEIATLIDKTGDPEKLAKNLRYYISDFRKDCAELFNNKIELLITEKSGYRINPALHVITDFARMEEYSREARKTKDLGQKEQLLRKSVQLYKGDIFPAGEVNPLLIGEQQYYKRIYRNIFEEYCTVLAEKKDFETMHHFATKGFKHGQHELIFYYYGLKALHHKASISSAKELLNAARENLDHDSYQVLLHKVNKEISPRYCAAST